MSVERRVDGSFISRRRYDTTHVRHVRNAGELVDLRPRYSTVATDLNQSVIGSNVEKPLSNRGFIDGADVSKIRRSRMTCDCIVRPGLSHQWKLVAVEMPGHVATKLLPCIAAVGASIQVLRSEINRVVIMRRNHYRHAPVVPEIHLAEFRLRLNRFLLARPDIVTDYSTILVFRVHSVRISRFDGRIESIAANGHIPVTVRDSLPIASLTRAGPAVVVLQAAVHIVERLAVIEIDRVVLRD